MGSPPTEPLNIPHTESLQLWSKTTQKLLEVPGKGSVPPACTPYWDKLGRIQCCHRLQTVPEVIMSPQTQGCIARSSQSTLNIIPDLHSKISCTQCCQVLGQNSWPSSKKYFTDSWSYSFPHRHHTSLKFFNFFKVHHSPKHTVRFCHTLKTTCPRALPSEYLNNSGSLVNQMKETKKWTSKTALKVKANTFLGHENNKREDRVSSRGLQQNLYQTPHQCRQITNITASTPLCLSSNQTPWSTLVFKQILHLLKTQSIARNLKGPKDAQIWTINLKLDVA